MARSREEFDSLREVRELVALIEEGAKPEPPPVRPSGRDAFWLALTVINAGLFFWLLPDKILKSDALDLVSGKVAPWLATSVFVAGYTWFRDEVLAFTRSKSFRALQIPLFLVLVVMEVPFVKVSAQLTPNDTELWVDGEHVSQVFGNWRGAVYTRRLQMLPRSHRLELKPPDTWRSVDVSGQVIDLSIVDLYDVFFHGRQFHWSLVFPVSVTFPVCRPIRMIAVRHDDAFDTSYLETYARAEQMRPVQATSPYSQLPDDVRSFSAFEMQMPAGRTSLTIRMPAGDYAFVATRDWGEETQPASLTEHPVTVRFSQCKQPGA